MSVLDIGIYYWMNTHSCPDLYDCPALDYLISERASASSFCVSMTTPAGSDIAIRSYQIDDLEAVVEFYQSFHEDSYHGLAPQNQGLPPKTESGVRAWLRDIVDEPAILARYQDEVVGHLLFAQDDDGGHELGVFLHPLFRGPAFKSKLVKAGLEYADKQGITGVWLTTRPDDIASQKVYEELGFELDKVDKPVKIIWMSTKL